MPALRGYRRMLAGLLAGMSGAVTLGVGLMFVLLVGVGWQLMQETASGVPRDQMWQALAQDLSRFPSFLWGWRWGFLALVGAALPLALVDRFSARVDQPWRGHLCFVALLGLVGAIVVTVQYLNRESAIATLTEHPDQLAVAQAGLISDWALLLLGAPLALLLSASVWALWSWWFTCWSRWLRAERPDNGTRLPAPAKAILRLRRSPLVSFLLALMVVTATMVGMVQFYHTARSQMSGGPLWVAPDSPWDTKLLAFTRPMRRLALANSSGDGAVLISLARAQDKAPVAAEQVMRLAGAPPPEQMVEIPVGHLPNGNYALAVLLREGRGGKLSYALFQAGSPWIQLVASLVGLSVGIWLVLVALVVLEALARWIWLDDPRDSATQ